MSISNEHPTMSNQQSAMNNNETPPTRVEITRLPHGEGLALPAYQTPGASGVDLLAALNDGQTQTIKPGARALIPTGIAMALPQGLEAQVRPRSGLAAKFGVTVLNTPGTIDSDYRGEIKVILINHGDEPFMIKRGERIAQLVVQKIELIKLEEVKELSSSDRGSSGFGSTGQ